MQVSDIKNEARSFLDTLRNRTTNICAAHLMGSINDFSGSDPFPPYLDVDIAIIQKDTERDPTTSLPYPGLLRDNEIYYVDESLLFECVYFSPEAYCPDENLLSSPGLTHNLACGENPVLYDPDGFIARAIRTVKERAFKPEWIKRRCLDQEQYARGALQKTKEIDVPGVKLLTLGWVGVYLSGMIAEALKQTPTHRRALVNLKRFCSEHQQEELYRRLLTVLGYDRMTADAINMLTDRFGQIIDRAIEIKRTPIPYSFKVAPGIEDYITSGTLEIAQEGHPQEAAFWIISALLVTGAVLLTDAPEQEKPGYIQDFANLTGLLGMDGIDHWPERLNTAQKVIDDFCLFAHQILQAR